MTCSIDGCARPAHSRGLCHGHYERQRLGRDMHAPMPATVEERFLVKVDKQADGCWLWTASTDGERRYGSFWLDGRLRRAHAVAYEMYIGPVPADCELDHLCRTTRCVNPAHLEPVPHRENVMRGGVVLNARARETCGNGHPRTPANTRYETSGKRACRACVRDNTRRYRERQARLTPE